MQIGVTGEDQRLDFRDLAEAALDSCRDSDPFGFDLIEGPAITIKRGRSTGQFLPAHDHDVNLLGIEFHADTDALGELRRRALGAAAQERFIHAFAALGSRIDLIRSN